LKHLDDRMAAYAVSRRAVTRFPRSSDAWMLAGEAAMLVFRQAEALTAYEQTLVIEERADAAIAAGALYARAGQYADAAARYARAYAAGGGPEALRQNAEALRRAGDGRAADEAMKLFRELSSRAGTR
jgi:tetratricopeptide (TPR) repeat protein